MKNKKIVHPKNVKQAISLVLPKFRKLFSSNKFWELENKSSDLAKKYTNQFKGMTKKDVVEAMKQAGYNYSPSTIEQTLSQNTKWDYCGDFTYFFRKSGSCGGNSYDIGYHMIKE